MLEDVQAASVLFTTVSSENLLMKNSTSVFVIVFLSLSIF